MAKPLLGSEGGPKLAVLFGAVTFGSHLAERALKPARLPNAALDAPGLCGRRVLSEATEPPVFPLPRPMRATTISRSRP